MVLIIIILCITLSFVIGMDVADELRRKKDKEKEAEDEDKEI